MDKIKILGLALTVGISPALYGSEGYYSEIDVRSDNLGEQLHKLIKEHRYISYRQSWSFLEDAHQADSKSVLLFYTRRTILKSYKASGSDQANNNFWNREHIWPQSYGLKGTDARRDLHNIVPADRSVNSSRGNKYFDDGGIPHNECGGCLSDKNSWEPPDLVKGDIARIVFYMDLRYDGNDFTGTPDLVATDGLSDNKRYLAGLSTLLKWHCHDPVDDMERRRNNIVFNYQGNRNPFVDHPDWAKIVFGFNCQ